MSSDIHVLPHAILHEVSVNEIALDQRANPDGTATMDDPVKLRLGAYLGDHRDFQGYIGTISMDVLRKEGDQVHRTEVGFLKFAIDEMVDGDRQPVPMIELFLTERVESTDQAMQRVLTASRKGVIFHVPVTFRQGAAVGQPVSSRVSRFYSDDGRYCYNVQGDPTPEYPYGRIVQYDTHGHTDETAWTPVAILKPTV